jgi:uncharacterized protein (DUF2147 family)
MRRLLTAAAAAVVLLAVVPAAAQKAEDAIGVWLNPENGSNVEFYRCGEKVCAKILKVMDGQKSDDKNPDPSKRDRPIIGLIIMEGGKKVGENKWVGTLYNRENGKSYSGTVTVRSRDALDLSGCVVAVLCKTLTWTRVR